MLRRCSWACRPVYFYCEQRKYPRLFCTLPKKRSSLKGLVIEVEGNIASGKSTVLQSVSELLNAETKGCCAVFGEMVNNDFLGAFYGNPKKYAFAFQMYMLTTRIHQMNEASRQAKSEGKIAFLDRGAVGDTLFAILNHRIGNMDDQSMEVYKSVCRQRLPASLSDQVDILLYLDTSPVECYRRVTTVRKNDAETGLPLAYLNDVDLVYFELLVLWLAKHPPPSLYDQMNIGSCPRAVVLQWDQFGSCEDVLSVLEQVQSGARKTPSVSFIPGSQSVQNGGSFEIISQQDLTRAYAELTSSGTIQFDRQKHVQILWTLPHDDAFRRVVFFFLSAGADLLMIHS